MEIITKISSQIRMMWKEEHLLMCMLAMSGLQDRSFKSPWIAKHIQVLFAPLSGNNQSDLFLKKNRLLWKVSLTFKPVLGFARTIANLSMYVIVAMTKTKVGTLWGGVWGGESIATVTREGVKQAVLTDVLQVHSWNRNAKQVVHVP